MLAEDIWMMGERWAGGDGRNSCSALPNIYRTPGRRCDHPVTDDNDSDQTRVLPQILSRTDILPYQSLTPVRPALGLIVTVMRLRSASGTVQQRAFFFGKKGWEHLAEIDSWPILAFQVRVTRPRILLCKQSNTAPRPIMPEWYVHRG